MVVDQYGEEIRRLFCPALSPLHCRLTKDLLMAYDGSRQITQLQVVYPQRHVVETDRRTLVVHIDGACRDNGKPTARAAWGVFVGPNSLYNAYGRLDPNLLQTSSRAEIEALGQALDIVVNITNRYFSLTDVKIVSDSEYVVNTMSMWIQDWIENGGVNRSRRPAAHYQKLKALHEKLDEMEFGDDGGLQVQFWHVPREENREADRLANLALNI
ncbi:ribonuclease H-like protein [Xylariomycetidae sp. FL0641]|nr:ribonuclease H-like protein [Xylariomycetidae sp. FL0641]